MSSTDYAVDKTRFGDGPWTNEPDKVSWTDEVTGLPCLILRVPHLGHLCGYVGVIAGSKCFKVDYDDVRAGDECPPVHGGLTFSGRHKSEPDSVWWLGFDCAHFGDFSPGMDSLLLGFGGMGNYRTVDFVRRECERLAAWICGQEHTP